jgi:hypothetical protein
MNRIALTIRRKPKIPKDGGITGSVTWVAICVSIFLSPKRRTARMP